MNALSLTTVKVYYSDNDLIPDEIQNRLIQWRDVERAIAFDIGDIAAECISSVSAKSISVTDQRVFEAIGHFCGKRPRTVRYYYETAVFYDQTMRDRYNILPFSHFVAARTYGTAWQDFLEISLLHPAWSAEAVAAELNASVAAEVAVAAGDPETEYNPYSFVPTLISAPWNVIDGKPQESPEISHNIPGRAIEHSRLSTIHAVFSRLDDLASIVQETEIDGLSKSSILEAIVVLRDCLPKLTMT